MDVHQEKINVQQSSFLQETSNNFNRLKQEMVKLNQAIHRSSLQISDLTQKFNAVKDLSKEFQDVRYEVCSYMDKTSATNICASLPPILPASSSQKLEVSVYKQQVRSSCTLSSHSAPSFYEATVAPSFYGATAAPRFSGAAAAPCFYAATAAPTAAAPSFYGAAAAAAAPSFYGAAAAAPSFYGAAAAAPSFYGAAAAPSFYGAAAAPSFYGAAAAPSFYGATAAPSFYGAAAAPSLYNAAVTTSDYAAATRSFNAAAVTPSSTGNAHLAAAPFYNQTACNGFGPNLQPPMFIPTLTPPERDESFLRIKEDLQEIIDGIQLRQRNRQIMADVQEIFDKEQVAINVNPLIEIPIAVNTALPPSEKSLLAPDLLHNSDKLDEEQASITTSAHLEVSIASSTVSPPLEELEFTSFVLYYSDKSNNHDTTKSKAYTSFQEDLNMVSSKKFDYDVIKERYEGLSEETHHDYSTLDSDSRTADKPVHDNITAKSFGIRSHTAILWIQQHYNDTLDSEIHYVATFIEVQDADIILIKHIIWIFDSGGITFYWRNSTTRSSFDGQGRNVRVIGGWHIHI